MRRLLILPFVLLVFAACNKSVTSYNGNFTGHWRTGVDTTAYGLTRSEVIFQGKDGAYNAYCTTVDGDFLSGCGSQLKGKAVIASDHKLIKIGTQSTITLTVDSEPKQVDGQWTMKLNGEWFTKM